MCRKWRGQADVDNERSIGVRVMDLNVGKAVGGAVGGSDIGCHIRDVKVGVVQKLFDGTLYTLMSARPCSLIGEAAVEQVESLGIEKLCTSLLLAMRLWWNRVCEASNTNTEKQPSRHVEACV